MYAQAMLLVHCVRQCLCHSSLLSATWVVKFKRTRCHALWLSGYEHNVVQVTVRVSVLKPGACGPGSCWCARFFAVTAMAHLTLYFIPSPVWSSLVLAHCRDSSPPAVSTHPPPAGSMRVITIPDQRMLLFSFQEPPEVAFKLVVGGPIIGERDVPQFKFIKDAFVASLEECLIGTRRSAVSLDVEWTVQEVGCLFDRWHEKQVAHRVSTRGRKYTHGKGISMFWQRPAWGVVMSALILCQEVLTGLVLRPEEGCRCGSAEPRTPHRWLAAICTAFQRLASQDASMQSTPVQTGASQQPIHPICC